MPRELSRDDVMMIPQDGDSVGCDDDCRILIWMHLQRSWCKMDPYNGLASGPATNCPAQSADTTTPSVRYLEGTTASDRSGKK